MSSDRPDDPVLTTKRLSRPDLFMQASYLYSQRSSCLRARVGAVAVQQGRIVSAGYAGAPSGQPECMQEGCIIENSKCVRSVHAEANLVSWAARTGTKLEFAEIYCTHFPCLNCAKLLHNAGVRFVVWDLPYKSQSDLEHEAVVKLISLKEFKYYR